MTLWFLSWRTLLAALLHLRLQNPGSVVGWVQQEAQAEERESSSDFTGTVRGPTFAAIVDLLLGSVHPRPRLNGTRMWLLGILLFIDFVACQQQLPSGGVCSRILDGLVMNKTGCLADEDNLHLALDSALLSHLTQPCSLALAKYRCANVYPRFVESRFASDFDAWTNGTLHPPLSLCQDAVDACDTADDAAVFQHPLFAPMTVNCTYSGERESMAPLFQDPSLLKPFVPTCEAYTGSVCKGVVDYEDIYVPAQATQAEIEAEAAKMRLAFSLPFPCGANLVKAVCASAFLRCTKLEHQNLTFLFPRSPCRSVCEAVQNTCPASVASRFQCNATVTLKWNCSATEEPQIAATTPKYPESSTVFTVGGTTAVTVCNPSDHSSIDPWQAVYCPFPTVKPDNPNANLGSLVCDTVCPVALFTSEDYASASTMTFVQSLVSFVLISEFLLRFVFFKQQRANIHPFVVICAASLWIFAVSLVASIFNRGGNEDMYSNGRCKNNSELNQQGDSAFCLWQSICVVVGSSSVVAAWMSVAIRLWLRVEMKHWSRHRWKVVDTIMYTWCIFYPSLLLVVFLSTENMAPEGNGVAWCLFKERNLMFGLFYDPIMVQTFIGLVSVTALLRRLWQSTQRTRDEHTHKLRRGWWLAYVRPVLFLLAFLLIWTFIFSYRFYIDTKRLTFADDMQKWIACEVHTTLSATLANLPLPDCSVLKPRPNKFLWFMLHFIVPGTGFFFWCVYGTKLSGLRLWLCTKPRGHSRVRSRSRVHPLSPSPRSRSSSTRPSFQFAKALKYHDRRRVVPYSKEMDEHELGWQQNKYTISVSSAESGGSGGSARPLPSFSRESSEPHRARESPGIMSDLPLTSSLSSD